MDETNLRALLLRKEGPTLDFKQELKEVSGKGKGPPRNQDELLKDILSLANGNATVAGEPKYLIFGASDQQNEECCRELFDIGNKYPTADDLLKMLRDACYPSLDKIESQVITLDKKRLLVITIPPTRYLHETTRKFETPSTAYTEYVVFARQDESIIIASDSDRAAIRRAKEKYFNERHDVPPIGLAAGSRYLSSFRRLPSANKVKPTPNNPMMRNVTGAGSNVCQTTNSPHTKPKANRVRLRKSFGSRIVLTISQSDLAGDSSPSSSYPPHYFSIRHSF